MCISLLTLIVTLSQKSWSCGIGSNVALPEQCWGWPCVRPVPRFAPGPQPSSSWVLSFGSDLYNVYRKLIFDEITRFLLYCQCPRVNRQHFWCIDGQNINIHFSWATILIHLPYFISNKYDSYSHIRFNLFKFTTLRGANIFLNKVSQRNNVLIHRFQSIPLP